jgi:2'-5' RNA ligase
MMNGIPAEMIDRWRDRADQAPGKGLVYWHVLVSEHAEVVALAQDARRRLTGFSGLHMTPPQWLHITALVAGSCDEITSQQMEQMADAASRLLAETRPIAVALRKVLYHREAITVAASPCSVLALVREAARRATREVTGTYGRPGNRTPWTPHVTLCYGTARQPAGPIVAALGHELPGCEVRISAISLVIQRGPERQWDWRPVATVRFGAPA